MQAELAESLLFGTLPRPTVAATLCAMTNDTPFRPIYVTRWTNFRALLARREMTLTAAAELLDKLQPQVSHFGGKRPTKPIGDQIAEEIEKAFGLGPGDLDLNTSGDEQVKNASQLWRTASQFDETLAPILAQAESWVRFEEKAAQLAKHDLWGPQDGLQSVRRARRVIAFTQEIRAHGGQLDREEATALIRARDQQGATQDGAASRGRGGGAAE